MKSKGLAYLLWFFFGFVGAHKFYLEKIGMGVVYLCTGGLLGIGWFIDLFTLGNQVDTYNALHGSRNNQNVAQNIIVNVNTPAAQPGTYASSSQPSAALSAEKQILALTERTTLLTLRQIIAQTNLELDEAETTVKKLVAKGLAREKVDSEGRLTYDFS
jgi:TM2 domain-containing membrane protein YozV